MPTYQAAFTSDWRRLSRSLQQKHSHISRTTVKWFGIILENNFQIIDQIYTDLLANEESNHLNADISHVLSYLRSILSHPKCKGNKIPVQSENDLMYDHVKQKLMENFANLENFCASCFHGNIVGGVDVNIYGFSQGML